MKTVFDNGMVAHVWAQQTQAEGRSNNGNLYFRDAALFSYGAHYCIGYIMPDGVALLNDDSSSISTNRHRGYAWQAVCHRTRIHVPDLTALVARTNLYLLPDRNEESAILQHVKANALQYSDDAALYLLGTDFPEPYNNQNSIASLGGK